MCTLWLLIGIVTGVYIDQLFTIPPLETYLDLLKQYIDSARSNRAIFINKRFQSVETKGE